MWFFCDKYNKIPGSVHLQLLSVCIDINSIQHSYILFSSAHHLKTDFSHLLSSAVVGAPPWISRLRLAELRGFGVCDPSLSAYPPTLLFLLWTWLLTQSSYELWWPTNAQCQPNHTVICTKWPKTRFLKRRAVGRRQVKREWLFFYAVKEITTRDTRNLGCVWKNRGDRGDEGRLVIMRKIEMSAITDHWLQTRVNISK